MIKQKIFTKLFEPSQSRGMVLKNRIVMAPMGIISQDHFVTETIKSYYEARAKGGAGLILVGGCQVCFPQGAGRKDSLLISADKYIPGMSQLVQVVHKHGAKIMLQLNHIGPALNADNMGVQPLAASPVSRTPNFIHLKYWQPREITVDEIAETTKYFANAAVRAQKAGFDGVEIDAGLRYLLNSFLSPYFNRRQDRYGGDLANRARFLLEVIAASREMVGDNYPIWCRINSEERQIKGGINLEMSKKLAPMLEQAGVDVIDVALQLPHSPEYAPGFNTSQAAEIKRMVRIPVMAGGRIGVDLGERLLREGKTDFICMGRALIADPDLPNKAASGKIKEIRPCINCDCCLAPTRKCAVNAAALGRESEYEIKLAENKKKVLIIGSGPSGMEAARTAALRGHQVTLFERGSQLGGELIMASLLRNEYADLLRYLKSQLEKLKVNVRVRVEMTPEVIERIKPDVVILATGAEPSFPAIPGMDNSNVFSTGDMLPMKDGQPANRSHSWRWLIWHTGAIVLRTRFGPGIMRQALKLWAPFGKDIVVMGSGLAGCEFGDFLMRKGKNVTIVDTRNEIPLDEPPMPLMRRMWNERIIKNGGNILTGVKYVEVTKAGLVVEKEGKRETIKADTIVFTAEFKPKTVLADSLKTAFPEIYLSGDCNKPCGILEAIHDGCRIAHMV